MWSNLGDSQARYAVYVPRMPSCNLNAVETRILGCLMEKERTTPENYPLSLNAITLACNQSTNRDPVTAFDETTVGEGLLSLREKKLATVIFGAGSRVQKYRHNLLDHYEFEGHEMAILCVLLLRGPQTPGELRSRTERMHSFDSLDQVEATLAGLSRDSAPLVRILPSRPGQKERRYIQLFSDESLFTESAAEASPPSPAGVTGVRNDSTSRLEALEKEVAALRAEVGHIREELTAFRKQFE